MRVVLCTCPADKAQDVARTIVEKRLAACVNIIPKVTSVYWWEDEICADEEQLLICKTRAERVASLTAAIKKIHPYDVPEVITMPLQQDEGNRDYLVWLINETRLPEGP